MTPIDIMMVNTGNTAGKVYSGKYGVLSNNAFKITFNEQLIDRGYLFSLLRSYIVQDSIQELFNSSGQPHVGHKNIALVSIPLPPTKAEQTAIANTLSDADALIQSLASLIAKKRQIKQGAMQTLLSPYENGRLKEGWVVKEVDEIAEVRSGKRLPLGNFLTHKETNHPYIRVTDMYYGGIRLNELMYVPNDIYPLIRNYRIFKEDIFISVAGTLGIVGKIPCELDGANLTENANRFTNIQCDRDYLLFVLSSPLIQNVIESEKTLGAQPKLALTRIRKFKIPLPIDNQEQTRIATILSGMDTEIAALEAKLAKYRHIKQGMMQNLLTGRIRLVQPDSKTGATA